MTEQRRRVLLWILIGALAAGVVVSGLVTLAVLLLARPIHGLGFLVFPAVPLLVAGQVALIRIGFARRRAGGRPGPLVLVEGLPVALAAVALVLALGGWLAAITAFLPGPLGEPVAGDAACPYRLRNHATVSCVSKADFDRGRARTQRSASGIFLSAFSVQGVTALSAGWRRRQPGAD